MIPASSSIGQIPDRWDELCVYSQGLALDEAIALFTQSRSASRGYNAVQAISLAGANPCRIYYLSTIGDPRVERIRVLLSKMDRKEASSKAKKFYLDALKKFQEDWDDAISQGGILPDYRRHSVASFLFLCSEFCSLKEFDALYLKWEVWFRQKPEHVKTLHYGGQKMVDGLFTANIYANAMDRHSGHEVAMQAVEKACQEAGLGQFGAPIRQSTKNIFRRDTDENTYVVIPTWGDNQHLRLRPQSGRKGDVDLHHALRCQAIPEVRTYSSAIESIKKWLEDQNLLPELRE